ncbi:MAG: thiamine phosphate synthase [Vicinamibacterales bacterium]
MLSRLASAVDSGVSMIQVRERHLDDRALTLFVRELVGICAGSPCMVVVNERSDVTLTAGAHGVHLKSDSVSVADVRTVLGSGSIVGRSVHSVGEATAVGSAGGCDYLVFGTVYPSSSKAEDHPVAGIEALRQVCSSVSLPVIAIGGISVARAPAVARAGAAGVAAISLFAETADMGRVAGELRNALTLEEGNV